MATRVENLVLSSDNLVISIRKIDAYFLLDEGQERISLVDLFLVICLFSLFVSSN